MRVHKLNITYILIALMLTTLIMPYKSYASVAYQPVTQVSEKLVINYDITEWTLDEENGYIYAVFENSNKLYFINKDDFSIEKELIVGSMPSDIEVYNGKIYITLAGATQIIIVDIITKEIEESIFIDNIPDREIGRAHV